MPPHPPAHRRSSLPVWANALTALALGAALGLAGGAPARAAAIHYNFENVGANPAATDNLGHDALNFQRDGVTLNVSARYHTGGTFGSWQPVNAATRGSGAGVYFGNSGLGVFLGGSDGNDLDGADGNPATDRDEALVLRFSQRVRLTALNFGRWDGRDNYIGAFNPYQGDHARIEVDGWGVYNHRAVDDHPDGLALEGTVFTINADDDATSLRLQDLDIQTLPVPEPGSLGLAGVALAGLAATLGPRRRRRRGG